MLSSNRQIVPPVLAPGNHIPATRRQNVAISRLLARVFADIHPVW
jgi:hypothetical protein